MRRPRSMFDPSGRREIVGRLATLRPETPPRWGTMSAPRMISHLTDQMRHVLGDAPVAARPGPLRWRWVRHAAIYWIPWPRGRLQGPPEAFVTRPGVWAEDLAELRRLVERFADRGSAADWPEHALLGPLTGRDWGVFCYKHFDHHLRQFGA